MMSTSNQMKYTLVNAPQHQPNLQYRIQPLVYLYLHRHIIMYIAFSGKGKCNDSIVTKYI